VETMTGLRQSLLHRAIALLAPFAVLVNPTALARGEEQLSVPNPHWGAFFSGKDQRVAIEPTAWPWQAIGRVNVADRLVRRHCTGTLVGARLVLTAGHCLYDHRVGGWAAPDRVHFVAGQARDTWAGHSTATEIIVPRDLDIANGTDPALGTIRGELMTHDWALIVLQTALPIKPVPVKAIPPRAFAQEVAAGELARAGYGSDRPYLLSVHRGCAAALSDRWPGAMMNRCDQTPGDAGSPLLLLEGTQVAFVVGLSAAPAYEKRAEADYVALAAFGPSATSFADAVVRALQH
ncbi:MAG: trypsin-like serine protease, partial [Hyphomicrobiaceae bacterium]|nr:trypsin-like serine protease [Hyphomicrobiaceae bacterium]